MAQKLPELFGSTETANELGVRLSNLGAIPDLPEPDQEIAAGRIWRADVIRPFAKEFKARRAERALAATRKREVA